METYNINDNIPQICNIIIDYKSNNNLLITWIMNGGCHWSYQNSEILYLNYNLYMWTYKLWI